MTRFTIRVELHGATSQHYISLAGKLRDIGIVDTIISDDNRRYKLPPAEYCYVGNATLNAVRTAVIDATKTVGRLFAVVVTEGAAGWYGLDQVA